jgi:hypothetical protein
MSTLKDIIGVIRSRAARRGLDFNLTAEWLADNTPERCPCCDVVMARGGDRRTSPSVDRINNALGYVTFNCWIICFRCNQIKSDHENVEALVADAGRASLVALAWRRHLDGWRWPGRDDLRPPPMVVATDGGRVLLAVADAGVPVGPTEVAKATGVAKSTAQKHMMRAVERGELTRDKHGKYCVKDPKKGPF